MGLAKGGPVRMACPLEVRLVLENRLISLLHLGQHLLASARQHGTERASLPLLSATAREGGERLHVEVIHRHAHVGFNVPREMRHTGGDVKDIPVGKVSVQGPYPFQLRIPPKVRCPRIEVEHEVRSLRL